MRKIILALVLISNLGFSQNKRTDLNFSTKYFDAVDKWVAFPNKDIDSSFAYGFIYLDNQAGFTFNYEDRFKIENGTFKKVGKNLQTGAAKYRIDTNANPVSILTKEQIKDLNLPDTPEWLSVYKQGSEKVGYLKNEGYYYNHAGACERALVPLLQAYKIEPHFEGLEFELSYAYNHLKQYKKAIPILDKAIKNNPKNFYFYRELGFSYVNLDQVKKAEEIYLKGISASDNDFEKSEMAINMAQAFFKLKNRTKFNEWAKLTKKYAKKNSNYMQYIEYFEKNWNKN
ncbi:tetratricopeptide repeat protein [uncultured Tenacibaculum sp.]|uniref:tetratricopeptide repeat protein n=1 Tax=uncultured Tenacibaculum sp. TaxID=174713 RepID=UPI002602ECBF|nr:tetratricopeptide repeat protein [uncultured Tenacibaculum sp.]